MSILAIVPARGGSKGIHNKNIRTLWGRPLLQWTLQAALDSKYIDLVVLSSDSELILSNSLPGVMNLTRPASLATDSAQIEPTVEHVLDEVGGDYATVVLLQPTSPLRTAEHIDEALRLMWDTGSDSELSVVASHALLWQPDGTPLYDRTTRPTRQAMAHSISEENGAIYATSVRSFKSTGIRSGGKVALYHMEDYHRVQIDDPYEISLAEILMEEHYFTLP
jgi:CMP-N,N'-diacetyllegionaminic acid synthase